MRKACFPSQAARREDSGGDCLSRARASVELDQLGGVGPRQRDELAARWRHHHATAPSVGARRFGARPYELVRVVVAAIRAREAPTAEVAHWGRERGVPTHSA